MAEQLWRCDKCQKEGTVHYEEGADVMQVAYLIEDDHKRLSPDCKNPAGQIKVLVDKEEEENK